MKTAVNQVQPLTNLRTPGSDQSVTSPLILPLYKVGSSKASSRALVAPGQVGFKTVDSNQVKAKTPVPQL